MVEQTNRKEAIEALLHYPGDDIANMKFQDATNFLIGVKQAQNLQLSQQVCTTEHLMLMCCFVNRDAVMLEPPPESTLKQFIDLNVDRLTEKMQEDCDAFIEKTMELYEIPSAHDDEETPQ